MLIVETSKTMRGLGGGTNIFSAVRGSCEDLIAQLQPGDTVTLIAFDTDVRPSPTVTIQTETERLRLYAMIDSLRADGNWTYTARSLELGLEEASRLEQALSSHQQACLCRSDGGSHRPKAGHVPASSPWSDSMQRVPGKEESRAAH